LYQRDFILRILEQIAELVAGILGLIKKGDFQKAKEKINETYSEHLKEEAGYFKDIPADDIIQELKT
jgi:hypothetical protein